MQQIELAKIRLDGGTQPRAEIDTELVSEYRDRMADGDTFPPVEVVFDGTDYWCWDGHHRVLAARRNGDNAIVANVRQGTLRDAQWLSFGANKDHGKRRERGDVRRALEAILADEEWSKTPQTKIAEHLGTSQGYVSEVKSYLIANDKIHRSSVTVTRNGTTYEMNTANIGGKSKSSNKPQSTSQPSPDDAEADEEIPDFSLPESGGKNNTESPPDGLGLPPAVREALGRAGELEALARTIVQIRTTVLKAIESGDVIYRAINPSRFQADCNNVARTLRAAKPFALCSYCRADKHRMMSCRACGKTGWVVEMVHKSTPDEMKIEAR